MWWGTNQTPLDSIFCKHGVKKMKPYYTTELLGGQVFFQSTTLSIIESLTGKFQRLK